MGDMTDSDDLPPTASEKLSAIVAARKRAAQGADSRTAPGDRRTERAAAARSASKSKPALRK